MLAVIAVLGFAVYPWLSNVREVLMVKGAAENAAARSAWLDSSPSPRARTTASSSGQANIGFDAADTTPACNGAVVSGYDWQPLSNERDGRRRPRRPLPSIQSGIECFRAAVAGTIFTVDTSPRPA